MSPEEFHQQYVQQTARHGVVDEDVACTIGVSRTTVVRWRHGTVAPHPLCMPHVFEAIDMLSAKVGFGQ